MGWLIRTGPSAAGDGRNWPIRRDSFGFLWAMLQADPLPSVRKAVVTLQQGGSQTSGDSVKEPQGRYEIDLRRPPDRRPREVPSR